jgi:hypothetical protein
MTIMKQRLWIAQEVQKYRDSSRIIQTLLGGKNVKTPDLGSISLGKSPSS